MSHPQQPQSNHPPTPPGSWAPQAQPPQPGAGQWTPAPGPGQHPPQWGPPAQGYGPLHPGPGTPWAMARPPALPTEPAEYHTFWRRPHVGTGRIIGMLLLLPVAFFLVSIAAVVGALAFMGATGGDPLQAVTDAAEGAMGPEMVAANSIGLGLLVPACLLIAWISGQRPGFIHSVVGKFRWGWSLVCLGLALVAVLIALGIQQLLATDQTAGTELQIYPHSWALLVVLMLVTPFQAAGEEYLIRGIGFRGVASLIPSRLAGLLIGALVTSLVFMAIHGAGDPWLNLTYFVMGLLFCYITWRTGGIEAAVMLHIGNNMVGMALIPFMDLGEAFDRSAGVGDPLILVQLLMLIIAAAIMEALARRRKLIWANAPAAEPPRSVPIEESSFAKAP